MRLTLEGAVKIFNDFEPNSVIDKREAAECIKQIYKTGYFLEDLLDPNIMLYKSKVEYKIYCNRLSSLLEGFGLRGSHL
jgi:hypothetical protein